MSNQIVISSGAKVRSLEGVLTGTAGIVNSVPLGGANGVATLDSNGKVPLSQLPASVVTYLGTWNAATNTPTLANGTGDVGDLYICNVAGTVNFGAGPITFAVGDWVIYNGSQWQKSAGQNGTVTSVAVTSTGNDAISITGSPITTAGTINIGFTGDNTQYINGAGDLTTFPSLTGYVPYTGATTDVDLGAHVLNAQALHVKGTAGAGHLGLKHQSAAATGSANESLIYANVDGDLAWQNDNLYLTTLSTHANTANRVYTFPDLTGTIAMLEGTQTISGAKTFSAGVTISNTGNQPLKLADYATSITTTTGYTTIGTNANGFQIVNGGGKGANFFFGSSTYGYYLPSSNGTIALTSDIPSLSGYVPYTGATGSVNLGANNNLTASTLFTSATADGGLWMTQASSITGLEDSTTYTSIKAYTSRYLYFSFGQTSTYKRFRFDVNGLSSATTITYTMPNASGTLALTSDIPSLANYVTLTGSQTITGIKTFTNEQLFGNGMTLTGGYITYTSGAYNLTLNTNILTANRNVFLQDKAGTIALTSDLTGGTVTSVGLSSATSGVTIGSSPITTSGTITLAIATASGSQQGLLSSTDWTTFNNKQNALTNPVTGTGTSSYHAKFTGTSTIGNSMLTDDGTTLQSIGATRSNLYLKAADSSYYSQLAFTNGSNGSFGGLSYNNSGQYMQFETNSSEWMRLTSDGKLGIGTTSPTYLLHAYSTNASTARIYLQGTSNFVATQFGNTGGAFYLGIDDSAGANFTGTAYGRFLYSSGAYPLVIATNGSERMRITSSGNVGIGTSSPTSGYKLDVKGLVRFGNDTNANVLYMGDLDANATYIQSLSTSGAARDLAFFNTAERMRITSSGYATFEGNGYGFTIGQATSLNRIQCTSGGAFSLLNTSNGYASLTVGAFSKSSGSFRIDHPIESMSKTHQLVHSFVESPQANNIYRGKIQLINGKAKVNLDEVSTMTEGTFILLNREIHIYTSNETDWDAVRGKVVDNILTIECQNDVSNAIVSWLVIGERQDKHMFETDWTDDNGRVIVEPLKEDLKNKEVTKLENETNP